MCVSSAAQQGSGLSLAGRRCLQQEMLLLFCAKAKNQIKAVWGKGHVFLLLKTTTTTTNCVFESS